jgi:hypothetical protein
LKWSIGKIAFYSFNNMSIQTLSGFSNSYDPAQTAQVDYYVSRNLTHIRSYVLVYVYVRQLYIYTYICIYMYVYMYIHIHIHTHIYKGVELQSKSQNAETWSATA